MKKTVGILVAFMMVLLVAPTTASAHGDRVQVRAHLDGDQEVVPVDTEMTGRFKVRIKHDELRFRLRVRDNSGTIVAAHIHCGAPGANGPVGVNLGVEPFSKKKGTVARGEISELGDNGCGWSSMSDVAAAIRSGGAYVNVHTLANPSGEIRGNLSVD